MANGHGGKRSHSGRKPKAHLYTAHISNADQFVAPKLRKYLQLIDQLAQGKVEAVEEIWKPAALVLVEQIQLEEVGGKLVPVRTKVPAFPTLRPNDMVMTEKRIKSGVPDLNALIYLANRVMGKPAGQPDEPEETDPLPPYDLSKLAGVELDTLFALLKKADSAPAPLDRSASGESQT